MNYEEMSDFEVNNRVGAAVGLKCADYPHQADDKSVRVEIYEDLYAWKDYCNNPADAWPIIIKNRISILGDSGNGRDDEWMACQGFWIPGEFDCYNGVTNANPLRAAMIVYLMMHEQSHNCPSAAC